MKKSKQELLYMWFMQKREKDLLISENILEEKAFALYNDVDVTSTSEEEKFTASKGWLHR